MTAGLILLCIDPHTDPIRVRRYKRNVHGKVWPMGEAELAGGVTEYTIHELMQFRSYLYAKMPMDHLPEGSA